MPLYASASVTFPICFEHKALLGLSVGAYFPFAITGASNLWKG